MLNIKRVNGENDLYDIIINDGTKDLNILFGGNGDLYFFVNKIKLDDTEQIVNFEITKENYFLYSLFENLYDKIINCDIYKLDETESPLVDEEEILEKINMYDEWNKDLKDSIEYKKLVNNGVISWRHDEQIYEEANTLNIHKEEDKYCLEFILKDKEMSHYIDVRFRNSGSRYMPFNRVFMQLYRKLQTYNPEYHQIHMEEYLYEKRLQLNNKHIY